MQLNVPCTCLVPCAYLYLKMLTEQTYQPVNIAMLLNTTSFSYALSYIKAVRDGWTIDLLAGIKAVTNTLYASAQRQTCVNPTL